jgi:hypothetical protein
MHQMDSKRVRCHPLNVFHLTLFIVHIHSVKKDPRHLNGLPSSYPSLPVFSPDTSTLPNIPQAGPFPLNIPQAGPFPLNIPQADPFPLNIPQAGPFPLNIPQAGAFPNIPQWPPNVPYMFPLTHQGSTTSLPPKVSDGLVTIKDEPGMPTNKVPIHGDPSKPAKSHVVGKEFLKKYGMYIYVYNDVNNLIMGSRW